LQRLKDKRCVFKDFDTLPLWGKGAIQTAGREQPVLKLILLAAAIAQSEHEGKSLGTP